MTFNNNTSVILVAGGVGSRVGGDIPKQYCLLGDKAMVRHSFDLFAALPMIHEIVVVCSPEWNDVFPSVGGGKRLTFALPGERRQDSVYHGFQEVSPDADLVCIHDAARPLVAPGIVIEAIAMAGKHGAVVVGVPLSFTIKECDTTCFVKATPDQSKYWEIQTPQVIKPNLLKMGFLNAQQRNLTVTDDVTLIEHLGHPVKVIRGSPENIKVTTSKDFAVAEAILSQRSNGADAMAGQQRQKTGV